MGRAYELLAETHKGLGNIEESKKHLEALLNVSVEGKNFALEGHAEAALKLGLLEYEEGSLSTAVTYLERHFDYVRKMEDKVLIDVARINLGIAKANYTLG